MNAYAWPDARGHFGVYGGAFAPETLMQPLAELAEAYERLRAEAAFQDEFTEDLRLYVGRPSPLYPARRLSEHWGGARVYLKREDLNHTGAHKINNTVGQALLARHMGKRRLVAETGAGQHGVATATVAARFGLACTVYMGAEDIRRQSINVYRMRLLGAEVIPVDSGARTLKDAINEAFRDWVTNVRDTFYVFGTVAGPHPYPRIVRDFQAVVGREVRWQIMEFEGRLPDALVACVGGGSNALGLFYPFLEDAEVALHGVEAAGEGIDSGRHAATLCTGRPGVLHGARVHLLQTDDGQIRETHSVSAGLDYPGVGPEHSWLKESGRARYAAATDAEAIAAFHELTRLEGIMPALESSHALAWARGLARELGKEACIVINLSGRGDKDIHSVAQLEGIRF